ncbi:ribosomal protein L13 family protein, partial [Striga asiatica]
MPRRRRRRRPAKWGRCHVRPTPRAANVCRETRKPLASRPGGAAVVNSRASRQEPPDRGTIESRGGLSRKLSSVQNEMLRESGEMVSGSGICSKRVFVDEEVKLLLKY